MWEKIVFSFLCLKVHEKVGDREPPVYSKIKAFVDEMIEDGDNPFFGLKVANTIFKELFYQEDF